MLKQPDGNYRVVLTIGDPVQDEGCSRRGEKKVDLSDERGLVFFIFRKTLDLDSDVVRLSARSLTQRRNRRLKIIDSRINAVGVAEPTLQRHGGQNSHQILLQMPGIQDPEHVKKLLGEQSHLEMVHVISPPSPSSAQTYATREEAIASLNSGGNVPANRRVLPYTERARRGGDGRERKCAQAYEMGGRRIPGNYRRH